MNKQREKPGISPQELGALTGRDPAGIRVSGGQFENFREGWAKYTMGKTEKVHYFVRIGFDEARSFCGNIAPVRWLYGPGNYERCSNCQRMANKLRKKG